MTMLGYGVLGFVAIGFVILFLSNYERKTK